MEMVTATRLEGSMGTVVTEGAEDKNKKCHVQGFKLV